MTNDSKSKVSAKVRESSSSSHFSPLRFFSQLRTLPDICGFKRNTLLAILTLNSRGPRSLTIGLSSDAQSPVRRGAKPQSTCYIVSFEAPYLKFLQHVWIENQVLVVICSIYVAFFFVAKFTSPDFGLTPETQRCKQRAKHAVSESA